MWMGNDEAPWQNEDKSIVRLPGHIILGTMDGIVASAGPTWYVTFSMPSRNKRSKGRR